MVVTCEHCGARYRLDPGRIEGRGARITCPRCRHVFVVYQDGASEAAPEAAAPVVERPTDVHSLDFKSVGISTWKVKTGIGLVYDFSDYKTLRKYLKEGRVSTDDTLSHDGEDWTVIGDISDLESHFIDAYVAAHSGMAKADAEAALEADSEPALEVDAESIADEMLNRLTTAEEPKAAVQESSAVEIGDQLLAAVEAATQEDADDEGGIDLDMDSLLEEASASMEQERKPSSARRGAEQKAVESVAKTGKDDENPHQFVDPFEALKQSRQQRTSTRTRRKSKKQAAAEAEASTKQRKQLIMAALLLCAAGAYFGINALPDEGPSEAQVRATKKQAESAQQEEAQKKRSEELRARMQENINKTLKDVKVEEINAFTVEEDQLIVKVPDEFKKGGKASNPMLPPSGYEPPPTDPVASGDVTQRALSAEDHIAMGEAAMRAKKWSNASSAFRAALELQPSNHGLRARLGFVLFKKGDMDTAEMQLRQASAAGAVAASKYLGHMAREQGDISGANSHYQAYLRSNPADAKAIEIMIQQMTP